MLKLINFGTKIVLLWAIIIYGFLFFSYYRTEITDNTKDFPVTAAREAVIKKADIPFKNLAYWDGAWYLSIADKGYFFNSEGQSNVVFFPLYPLVIRAVHNVIPLPWPLLGSLINVFFLLLAGSLLFKEIKIQWGEMTAKFSLWYVLIFPSAMFFILVYSEALFFLLAVGIFSALRQKKWWLVGILGFLISLTRPIGVLMLAVALVEYWLIERKIKKDLLWLALMPLGLLSLIIFFQIKFHDPLLFIHGQQAFQRTFDLANIKGMLLAFWGASTAGERTVLFTDIISGIFTLVAGFLAFKWLKPSYAVYVLLGVLTPLLTFSWQSLNRYVLVLFPIFIIAAKLGQKYAWFHYSYIMLMPMILAIQIVQFVHFAWAG